MVGQPVKFFGELTESDFRRDSIALDDPYLITK